MQISIRRASRQDIHNLAALSIQVWLHTYATDGIRQAISEYVLSTYTPNHFVSILDDPNQIILIAEYDNHLLGYAKLHTNSPAPGYDTLTSELCTLYVQEHFHRQGIGEALLQMCRTVLTNHANNNRIWLSVYHRNSKAIQFYEKHGFSQCSSFHFEFGGESHLNYVLAN